LTFVEVENLLLGFIQYQIAITGQCLLNILQMML